ncbi:hypothetical protein [Streptomyces sp. NPDC059918]|uniref:hypothetical protein n=1 Tax=unclassified Streptomyces TaxID=2593676 RepID=UPI00364860FA
MGPGPVTTAVVAELPHAGVTIRPGDIVHPSDGIARTITELHRLLLGAAAPYTDQIRRSEPRQALDTVARAILIACFHNSVRPDAATGEAARRRYANELGDMAIAYLLTPDRRRSAET